MVPISNFAELIRETKEQFDKDFDELLMAADLLGSRPNYFTMDERGMFHAQANGPLDEVIRALEHHLEKLKRIQTQKNAPK